MAHFGLAGALAGALGSFGAGAAEACVSALPALAASFPAGLAGVASGGAAPGGLGAFEAAALASTVLGVGPGGLAGGPFLGFAAESTSSNNLLRILFMYQTWRIFVKITNEIRVEKHITSTFIKSCVKSIPSRTSMPAFVIFKISFYSKARK